MLVMGKLKEEYMPKRPGDISWGRRLGAPDWVGGAGARDGG